MITETTFMRKKILITTTLILLGFVLMACIKKGFPCHPAGDVGPCTHRVHLNDVGPCQHNCVNVYGQYIPCHPNGDLYPCTHPFHLAGDLYPCTHICY